MQAFLLQDLHQNGDADVTSMDPQRAGQLDDFRDLGDIGAAGESRFDVKLDARGVQVGGGGVDCLGPLGEDEPCVGARGSG